MLRIGTLLTAAFLGGTLPLAAQAPFSPSPRPLPSAVVTPVVQAGYTVPMDAAPGPGPSPYSGLIPHMMGKSNTAAMPSAPPAGPPMLPNSYPGTTVPAPMSGQSQSSGLVPRLLGKPNATPAEAQAGRAGVTGVGAHSGVWGPGTALPPAGSPLPSEVTANPEPGKYTGILPRLATRFRSGPAPVAAPAEGPPAGKDKVNLVGFFTYRPCSLTGPGYLCMPYNPRPPLYLYFLYPPLLERGPHQYPPDTCRNCWNGRCSAGPHMFALPSMQNAGFSDGGPGPYPPLMTPGAGQPGQGQGTSGPGMGAPASGMGSSGGGLGFSGGGMRSGF